MSTNKYYPDSEASANFAEISNKILDYWEKNSTFEASVENRPKEKDGQDNQFVFFDGPPFANGLPHYGHLLTGFVKDIVARYQTLRGKRVERRFGWDCHGLPVEMAVEKELKLSGRTDIIKYGIDKFNEHCRQSVLKYTSEWQNYVTQQARWVDFKNSYKTMDLSYMESVLWVFKKLYDAGLVYESKRVMPYSWACQTPLSNFETRMDNSYRQVADKAVTVKFTLKNPPHNAPKGLQNYHLLAWTTTPWTLPSNLALAVGKDITYSCITLNNECFILATSALAKYKKELNFNEEDYAHYSKIKGCDLEELEYNPLFDYFKDHPNSFKVFAADFILEGEGTGVVHIAPGFGEDDFALCVDKNIELVCPVDDGGKFTSEVYDFAGQQVFEANDKIIIKLKEQRAWVKTEQYIHNYPHCWRTDTPLIYKAVPSWYVKVTAIKEKLIENNKKINWIPEHIKEGLFGKWLENVRDWSISRNRFWGTPIPIWMSDNPEFPRVDVYGSVAEIEKDFGVKIKDLHRPFIDEIIRPNPDDPSGKSLMKRVTDVFDCWFDSGSMPYGQAHYPFQNKEQFEKHSSADFIVEYTAQTRGWFYTLTVLAVALFDKPAFLNCICHGVILDEQGEKLSKRLRNYVDPQEVFNTHGSDALRFFMASSSVLKGQELHIDKDGKIFAEIVRLVLKPIWNAYHFFTLYANSDHIKANIIYDSSNLNDKYILSKLKYTIERISSSLDEYDIPSSCAAVRDFSEVLNNWYIRRNRSRFWRREKDHDKQEAYDTLYTVLYHMCIAASPLLPLLLEHIYLGLTEHSAHEKGLRSVHLADYPDSSKFNYYQGLVEDIDKVRAVCTSGLNIRNTYNIRTRQPLQTLTIVGKGLSNMRQYFDLIKDEVNVKEIILSEEIEKHAKYNLKINFKLIADRLKAKIKDIIAASKQGEWRIISSNQILICDEVLVNDEFSLTLEATEDMPSTQAELVGALVMLNTTITKELKLEAMARDVVRLIQQMRKDAEFDISDRISIDVNAAGELLEALELYESYIREQTLTTRIRYLVAEDKKYAFSGEFEVEQNKLTIALSKNRPNSKVASDSIMLGADGVQNRSVSDIRKDSSTGATKQDAAEVEFPKGSNNEH